MQLCDKHGLLREYLPQSDVRTVAHASWYSYGRAVIAEKRRQMYPGATLGRAVAPSPTVAPSHRTGKKGGTPPWHDLHVKTNQEEAGRMRGPHAYLEVREERPSSAHP